LNRAHVEPQANELLTPATARGDSDSESSDRVMSDFAEYVLPNYCGLPLALQRKAVSFLMNSIRRMKQGKPEFDETTPPISRSIRICSMDCFSKLN